MFIYVKDEVKRLKERWRIDKINQKNGFYYEVLFKNRATPHAVARAVKLCDKKKNLPIVCREGTKLSRREVERFLDVSEYDTVLLINAFSYIIAGGVRALVIDETGDLCDRLRLPLLSVKTLYVLTRRPDLYEKANERSLRTVGSGVIILEDVSDCIHFDAVLMPNGTKGFGRRPSCFAVFGKGGYMPCGESVHYNGNTYERRLAAAMYMCFGDKKSELCLPSMLFCDNRKISPEGLKNRLDSRRMDGL